MAYQYEIITALADPTRQQVFERLRHGACSVGEIASGLSVSRPAVSQHLKVLKQSGLVVDRARGTRRFYSSKREGLQPLRVWLEGFWDEALASYAAQFSDEDQGEHKHGSND